MLVVVVVATAFFDLATLSTGRPTLMRKIVGRRVISLWISLAGKSNPAWAAEVTRYEYNDHVEVPAGRGEIFRKCTQNQWIRVHWHLIVNVVSFWNRFIAIHEILISHALHSGRKWT